uniref:Uncharacterized protein n=1 Tax=Bactrocera dorsalis TaxID=27457 RepID=A0A034W7V1_BACDO
MDLRNKNKIFLVGSINLSILGSKLPSNKQVLQVLFFNIRVVKLSVCESANLVIREVLIFWEKARLPTKEKHHCTKKLHKLYDVWRFLQKNNKKSVDSYREKEKAFVKNLDNLFDVAHADVMKLVKIEEDRLFLLGQRQQGRVGYLGSVDFNLCQAEEKRQKRQKRRHDEAERRERNIAEQKIQPGEISFSSISDDSNEVDSDQAEAIPSLKKSRVVKPQC